MGALVGVAALALMATAASADTVEVDMLGTHVAIKDPEGWTRTTWERTRYCWERDHGALSSCVGLGQTSTMTLEEVRDFAIAQLAEGSVVKPAADNGCKPGPDDSRSCDAAVVFVDFRGNGASAAAYLKVVQHGRDVVTVWALLTDIDLAGGFDALPGFIEDRVELSWARGTGGEGVVGGDLPSSYDPDSPFAAENDPDYHHDPSGSWPSGAQVVDRRRVAYWGWFQIAATRSQRDLAGAALDPAQYPEGRTLVPGFVVGTVVTRGPLLVRGILAASPNWGAMFGADDEDATGPTADARYGGAAYEGGLELGLAIPLGAHDHLGATAGWTGLWGPVTRSSSLSASLVYAHVPASLHANGFFARVTPVQVLNSNERWLMAPLTIEAELGLGMLVIGGEVQWIAAPEPGDDSIAAAGWAASVRLGYGFVGR